MNGSRPDGLIQMHHAIQFEKAAAVLVFFSNRSAFSSDKLDLNAPFCCAESPTSFARTSEPAKMMMQHTASPKALVKPKTVKWQSWCDALISAL
jgi:hypothetical protein